MFPDVTHEERGGQMTGHYQKADKESCRLCFSSQMLSTHVPALVNYLTVPCLGETLLGALVEVSQACPSSLVSFLPALRTLGQRSPAYLAYVAKIHGAVGIISEVKKHKQI